MMSMISYNNLLALDTFYMSFISITKLKISNTYDRYFFFTLFCFAINFLMSLCYEQLIIKLITKQTEHLIVLILYNFTVIVW